MRHPAPVADLLLVQLSRTSGVAAPRRQSGEQGGGCVMFHVCATLSRAAVPQYHSQYHVHGMLHLAQLPSP